MARSSSRVARSGVIGTVKWIEIAIGHSRSAGTHGEGTGCRRSARGKQALGKVRHLNHVRAGEDCRVLDDCRELTEISPPVVLGQHRADLGSEL